MWSQTVQMGQSDGALLAGQRCLLCERRCAVDRPDGPRGVCGATGEARVYRHRVEYGEEIELVPSHLFYLSGCNLRCAFCIAGQNGVDARRGRPLAADFFAEAVAWGRSQGAKNIQWVGGEPTIHLPAILEVMDACSPLPPVVWKSNFYATPESLRLLCGVVDVFVADFKFGNDDCARRIADADRYTAIVGRNLIAAAGEADLIVRHLLLPGHFDCCYRPIVAWMQRYLPHAKFNVLGGYLPCWQADKHAELATTLGRDELRRARRLAADSGLDLIS